MIYLNTESMKSLINSHLAIHLAAMVVQQLVFTWHDSSEFDSQGGRVEFLVNSTTLWLGGPSLDKWTPEIWESPDSGVWLTISSHKCCSVIKHNLQWVEWYQGVRCPPLKQADLLRFMVWEVWDPHGVLMVCVLLLHARLDPHQCLTSCAELRTSLHALYVRKLMETSECNQSDCHWSKTKQTNGALRIRISPAPHGAATFYRCD